MSMNTPLNILQKKNGDFVKISILDIHFIKSKCNCYCYKSDKFNPTVRKYQHEIITKVTSQICSIISIKYFRYCSATLSGAEILTSFPSPATQPKN